ncbi:protein FAM32A-like [Abrus precatorius]|uniref:Protein FAM32A-like n=1 Tax=Abrus precatorius TaxID=3816 RepID=A0A8B8LN07_ABRPR|nr:protein FAM32A-like [Abrus precatorius]
MYLVIEHFFLSQDEVMQTAKDSENRYTQKGKETLKYDGNMSTDDHEDSINETDKYGGNENGASYDDHLTPAERRFLQQTHKLEFQRLAKMASMSHRDRIHQFNQYLANLSEHYDIPKVGPG